MENQKKVVLYGAGSHIKMSLDYLIEKYSPVAFCDSSLLKTGIELWGLPVLSLNDTLTKYPECIFYVTPTNKVKFEIINTLLKRGISADRIINFEESKKYISCSSLESCAFISNKSDIQLCCSGDRNRVRPRVEISADNKTTLENLIKTRDGLISRLNVPIPDESHPCFACTDVYKGYWSENRYLRSFSLSGMKSVCNIKCSYCGAAGLLDSSKDEILKSVEWSLSFLDYLREQNQINYDTIIELGAGEITAHPYREMILSAIFKHPVVFYSNAVIYNDKIAAMLSNGRSRLVSSIDCGTRETFLKIKGVDAFNKVCDNLKQYSTYGIVELKYIFLPGLNDNDNDINGFISICKNIGTSFVSLARDFNDNTPLDNYTFEAIKYLITKLRELNISVSAPRIGFFDYDEYKKISVGF